MTKTANFATKTDNVNKIIVDEISEMLNTDFNITVSITNLNEGDFIVAINNKGSSSEYDVLTVLDSYFEINNFLTGVIQAVRLCRREF